MCGFWAGFGQEDDCTVQAGSRAAVQTVPLRLWTASSEVSTCHGWRVEA